MSGTNGRVTQAGLSVLDGGGGGSARVTQAGASILYNDNTDARVTQAGLSVLALDVTQMRVTQAGFSVLYLDSVGGRDVSSACLLWRLTLAGGTVRRFAMLDVDVTYGGEVYAAAAPFDASASELARTLEAGQIEVAGLIDNASLTPTEILNGVYDGAWVEVFRVDWQNPAGGAEVVTAGRIGAVSTGPLRFEAEAVTPAAQLAQQIGSVVQPGCRWAFGDARCGIALASWTQAHTVTAAASRAQFTAAGFTAAAGWADYGLVTFTSGANAGAVRRVRDHAAGGVLTLWEPLAVPPAPGDGVSIVAGCDRRLATCRDRFSNVANFGGFPFVKGEDSAGRYPDAR